MKNDIILNEVTMKPESFMQFTFLSSLKANPSHTVAAFVKSSVNSETNAYDSVIMVLKDQKIRQMTYLNQETNVMWIDDDTLAFIAKRDEKASATTTKIYALSLHGGEAFEYFSVRVPLTSLAFLKDGSCIALALFDREHPLWHTYSEAKQTTITQKRQDLSYVQHLHEVPFYTNGGTFKNNTVNRLVHISRDGKAITPLTSIQLNVSSFKVRQDEKSVVFVGAPYHDITPLHSFIYETTISTPKVNRLSKAKVGISGIELLDERIIAFVNDRKQFGLNQNSVVCELVDRTFKLIYDPIYAIGNTINSDVRLFTAPTHGVYNDTLVIHCTKKDHSLLLFFDKTLKVKAQREFEGSIDGLTMLNGEWVMIAMHKQSLQEIITSEGLPLSTFNAHVFDNTTQCTPISHHVHHHGRNVDGYVILPPNYNQTTSYPAILVIHGGPKTVYGSVYTHEMHGWAHAGYVVMYCNPKGSDGLDNTFADIRGAYGSDDMDDLMAFVDDILKHYTNVDAARLGIIGGSYGGYMTNWITAHTSRFKAAVTQRGICNWTSFYGVSDIGHYFVKDQVQADVLNPLDFEKLWNNSPLKYVSQVKTPTLVIHASLDYRCPVDQGYQWFTALKLLQVPTRMVLFHEENHDLARNGKPKARLYSYNVVLEWFNTYLK